MTPTQPTTKTVIGRSFIVASIGMLVTTLIAAIYFNQRSINIIYENNAKKTHVILSDLLSPALSISDSTEIRRLLTLASRSQTTFAVIDHNNNVLLPDYNQLNLVDNIITTTPIKSLCSHFQTIKASIHRQRYWINCSPILNRNMTAKIPQQGLLVSFTYNPLFSFSPMMIYFISIALAGLTIIVAWFYRVLQRRLLHPLLALDNYIVCKADVTAIASPIHPKITNAPLEVHSIKNAFDKVLTNLEYEYHIRGEAEKKSALLDLAAHVAHDIQSPLAVVELIVSKIGTAISHTHQQILLQATQSVRDIATNLLSQYRKSDVTTQNTSLSHDPLLIDDGCTVRSLLLVPIIENIISQKRIEWQQYPCRLTTNIDSKAELTWIEAAPSDIKRIISNLLNNAYEALTESTRAIHVELTLQNNYVELIINDTGCGINEQLIPDILNGVSSKHAGKGFGVSSAKQFIESLNGQFALTSSPRQGTQVTLHIPVAKKPDWFTEIIYFSEDSRIIILDDDINIHNWWRQHANNANMLHFMNADELLNWQSHQALLNEATLYFVDYDLHDVNHTGLTVLQQLPVTTTRFLVTSHADKAQIQAYCKQHGIWLLPKHLLGKIAMHKA